MSDEVVKIVKLTDEQVERLAEIFDNTPKELAALVVEAIGLMAKRKREAWDEVAKLLGYESEPALRHDGFVPQISWIEPSLRLIRRKEDDECSSG